MATYVPIKQEIRHTHSYVEYRERQEQDCIDERWQWINTWHTTHGQYRNQVEWCMDNLKDSDYFWKYDGVYFRNPADATMFLLRWA